MKTSKTIIGKSPAFESLLCSVQIIAPTDVNVLITGETGTGKELIAAAIQQNSRRSDKVFITLNCAALSESLIESELFGCAKGAFTDAYTDKQGLFGAADGGTLFLDEINSLPVSAQAKLLRFIELGEYVPVGSVITCKADVRIIAATNINLSKLVKAGLFRQDLYFRLSVVPLELPPLRERPGDIRLLTKHFMNYFAEKYAVKPPVLSKEVWVIFKRHPWPGNVRELSNLCENLCILKIRKIIEVADLPSGHLETFNESGFVYCFRLPESGIVWHELEADLIQQALVTANRNLKEAARLLGITKDALAYRVKKYGLSAV